MHLLHLTDLHLTQASKARRETLIGIWGQATQALPRRIDKFDFVLVTGDLTQAADEADYREVEGFFAELVDAHVRRSDPRRVVIVPGNHDVQWGASIGEPVDVRRLSAEPHLRQEFKALLKSPQTSPLRMRLADTGEIDRLWRVREDAYGTRFKNFSDSLDRFYGKPLEGSPDRRFQLTSNDDASHWSAHVFAEEKIAFFGFSSCHRNDRDWTGASIAHAAIDAARKHADAVAPLTGGWTRVLLWHHGLRSDWGTPDVLSTDDLGKLASLAPALGLHGHTHEDEITDLKDTVRYHFPVIATGSFAVSRPERPIPNQFSIVELSRSLIRWDRIERDERGGGWAVRTSRETHLFTRCPVGRITADQINLSRVGTHHRRVVVNPQGIAVVTVTLQAANLEGGSFCLAHLRAPLTPMAFDHEAQTETDPLRVEEVRESDGSRRYLLHFTGELRRARITWEYGCANAFALSASDLQGRTLRDSELRRTENVDALAHVVQSACGELVLELQLPADCIAAVSCRADRQEHGSTGWKEDAAERAALNLTPDLKSGTAKLSVREPVPGHRYVMLYQPRGTGALLTDNGRLPIDKLIDTSRNAMDPSGNSNTELATDRDGVAEPDKTQVSRTLRDKLQHAMARALGATTFFPPARWVAYLWHDDTQRLWPAFGNFPSRDWGCYFLHGEGIVGHSFRVRGPAIHFKRETEQPSWKQNLEALLLLPSGEGRKNGRWLEDHRWIVAVPISQRRNGPAVGVVGFADFDGYDQRGINAVLREMARHAQREGQAGERLDSLIRAISLTFWTVLADHAASADDPFWLAHQILVEWNEEVLVPTNTDRERRAQPRMAVPPGKVSAHLRCPMHGELTLMVRDQSEGGFGATGALCYCIGRGSKFPISLMDERHVGTVRYRSATSVGIQLTG